MKVGVISPYEISRKGLYALITSSPSHVLALELPGLPEDLSILSNAQLEVLLVQTNGSVSDLEFVSHVHKAMPKIKIILLLDNANEETEFQALKAGASGCLSRSFDLDTLVNAFEVVGRGDLWVSHQTATRLIQKLVQKEKVDGTEFTSREWEILSLLAKGFRNKEIASALSLSENTVKTHLASIYRKINVDCRLAATLYYFQHPKLESPPIADERNAEH